MIETLDHVNIQTRQLSVMVDWYRDVLGLSEGPRPDFPFPGAWMYAGDRPIVHLVEEPNVPRGGGPLALEHAAFRASGLKDFLARLDARGERYSVGGADFLPIVLVNVWDPDGNHLHVDFAKAEAEGVIEPVAPKSRPEPTDAD